MELNPRAIAAYIDHTVLKPQASLAEVKKICEEAKEFRFASVCVNPCYIRYAAEQPEGSGVTPCCVIGFPLGACTPIAAAQHRKAVTVTRLLTVPPDRYARRT